MKFTSRGIRRMVSIYSWWKFLNVIFPDLGLFLEVFCFNGGRGL